MAAIPLLADPVRPDPRHAGKPDFAQLVGAEGWRNLAPAIRRRFTATPLPATPIRYEGVMSEVACSPAGWLLAQFCRLFGTPFAPWRGRDVPVAIVLRRAETDGAIVWEREYRYPERNPIRVRSEKRMAADGGLLECVGPIAMRLAVSEEAGALHFRCHRYVWRLGRWNLSLPEWLSPGAAHVLHEDLGQGRFRFAMSIRHKLLGLLFYQDGVFQEAE
jgi:hypothetical protein